MPVAKKIVIVGPAHPLRGGGMSTFNERLAKAYSDRGDDVQIFSFSMQYPSFLFPGKSQFTDEPAPEGIRIRSTINSINPISWYRTGRTIRKLDPDLVIIRYWIPFMGPALGTIARRIRKNRRTRIIAITDNVIPHEKRPGDKIMTRYFLKPIHGFVTMSKSVMNDLALFNETKPRTLCLHPLYDNYGDPIGKRDALEALHLLPGNKYLLSFGLVRKYKGLDLLIRALASKKLAHLPLKLIVAGEFYDDFASYRKLVEELGVYDRVIMENTFIPNAEVVRYFCAADLVVQPYRDATQSGVTQVAYHFDKPMVVSNVGALPEMVPDGKAGYVVDPDPESIAEAIRKFFDENKQDEFSANVREEKKKYSWDVFLAAIDALVDKTKF
ncbi:MAG: glycosyltransferase [Bacteroidales bacterium]|jgi:glycosyltransferase involved in cell wall biosynthesis|nr:glycosyltransferase [Bacteroidales bacterium]